MAEVDIIACGEGIRLIQATAAVSVEDKDSGETWTMDTESMAPSEFLENIEWAEANEGYVCYHPKDSWFFAMRGNINDWSDLQGPYESQAEAAREALDFYYPGGPLEPYTYDELHSAYGLYGSIVEDMVTVPSPVTQDRDYQDLCDWLEFKLRVECDGYDESEKYVINLELPPAINDSDETEQWRIVYDFGSMSRSGFVATCSGDFQKTLPLKLTLGEAVLAALMYSRTGLLDSREMMTYLKSIDYTFVSYPTMSLNSNETPLFEER